MIISSVLLVLSVTVFSIPSYCIPVTDSEYSPTVCIADGCIQGKAVDESFEAFLGIPFAEPPIGNLRFAVS